MRSKLALACMLAVALIAPAALPCGAPFGNGINVDPTQDIVVAHKNGVETYVFQPRFCGSAKEFGLILPIPAKLSAQPALSKAEVFTYLTSISQPTYTTSTVCSSYNSGTGGSRAGGTGDGGAVVVSSGSVGFMDYSQLEAGSVTALTTWLDANGYPYDSLATSTFDYYVQKSWYFVAFKVNQGTTTGTSTCKDLGPVKLAFPTTTPVVPTRMAAARSKDTSGSLSYATQFSWRIYGITAGTEQIGFADGETSTRELNYSGLLVADDTSHLDGLGVAGDRADKLTITFSYGSTDPDVALQAVAGKDYRQVINQVSYVICADAGVDSGTTPTPTDGGRDVAAVRDAGIAIVVDTGVLPQRDGALSPVTPDVARDTVVTNPPEPSRKADAAVVLQDAGSVSPATPDAAVASDAGGAPVEPTITKKDSGCSLSGARDAGTLAPLVLAGLLLGMLRRRRR